MSEAKAIVAGQVTHGRQAFTAFILGIAKVTAEAAHGVDAHEQAALETLQAALA